MSDDIEAFLRQAARRRAERKRPIRQRQSEPIVEAEAVPASPSIRPRKTPPRTGRKRPPRQGERSSVDQTDHRLHGLDDGLVDLSHDGSTPMQLSDLTEVAPEMIRSEMGQLLRNPQSLRQAILVSEILRRPQFRR